MSSRTATITFTCDCGRVNESLEPKADADAAEARPRGQDLEIWTRFATAAVAGRCALVVGSSEIYGSCSTQNHTLTYAEIPEDAARIADSMLELWRDRRDTEAKGDAKS
jgi:hypothetical protein